MIGRPHTGVNQLSFSSVDRMFSRKITSQKDLFWELEFDFLAKLRTKSEGTIVSRKWNCISQKKWRFRELIVNVYSKLFFKCTDIFGLFRSFRNIQKIFRYLENSVAPYRNIYTQVSLADPCYPETTQYSNKAGNIEPHESSSSTMQFLLWRSKTGSFLRYQCIPNDHHSLATLYGRTFVRRKPQ